MALSRTGEETPPPPHYDEGGLYFQPCSAILSLHISCFNNGGCVFLRSERVSKGGSNLGGRGSTSFGTENVGGGGGGSTMVEQWIGVLSCEQFQPTDLKSFQGHQSFFVFCNETRPSRKRREEMEQKHVPFVLARSTDSAGDGAFVADVGNMK